jgi:hypothetical protein
MGRTEDAAFNSDDSEAPPPAPTSAVAALVDDLAILPRPACIEVRDEEPPPERPRL